MNNLYYNEFYLFYLLHNLRYQLDKQNNNVEGFFLKSAGNINGLFLAEVHASFCYQTIPFIQNYNNTFYFSEATVTF